MAKRRVGYNKKVQNWNTLTSIHVRECRTACPKGRRILDQTLTCSFLHAKIYCFTVFATIYSHLSVNTLLLWQVLTLFILYIWFFFLIKISSRLYMYSHVSMIEQNLVYLLLHVIAIPLWIRLTTSWHVMTYHQMLNWKLKNVMKHHKMSAKLSSGLCHQISWNIFQFNTVTFDDKWRHLMIFRDISWHSWNVFQFNMVTFDDK